MLYVDADNDGYGLISEGIPTCLATAPLGFSFNNQDCDDNDPLINPGATEIPCNFIDENCNDSTINDDSILPVPITTNDTICSGELPSITADADNGFNVFWYTDANRVSGVIGVGSPFSPVLPINTSSFPITYIFLFFSCSSFFSLFLHVFFSSVP